MCKYFPYKELLDIYISFNPSLNNFLAVIEKKEEPICSGMDGLNTLAVIEAIKLAAKTKTAVKPETLLK